MFNYERYAMHKSGGNVEHMLRTVMKLLLFFGQRGSMRTNDYEPDFVKV